MERAAVQRSVESSLRGDDLRPAVAAEIVQETVEECERLLLDAEATADQIRLSAEEDAARVRRDALRSNARLLTDVQQRRPEVEASMAAARSVAQRAMALSEGMAADVQRRVDDVVAEATVRAEEITDQAEEHLAAATAARAAVEAAFREAAQRRDDADLHHAAAMERAESADEALATASARMEEAEGMLAVATQVLAAAEASRRLTDQRSRVVEARSAEVEHRFAELRAATDAAVVEVNTAAWAAEGRRVSAEAEAVRIGARARHAARVLQRELLDTANAEALEITWAACVDAAQIRQEAEDHARALSLQARLRNETPEDAVAAVVAGPIEVEVPTEPEPLVLPSSIAPLAGSLVEAPPTVVEEPPPARSGHRRQVVAAVLLVVVVAVLVRLLVAAPYSVESDSMEPTLVDGEEVIVNRLAYRVGDPDRGDVVVVDLDGETLVKRIVGLPGEEIEGRDGAVLVDGREISEPYLVGAETSTFAAVTLGADQLFVLGDNRAVSADSRSFGPITTSELVGRADAVLWPLSDLRRL